MSKDELKYPSPLESILTKEIGFLDFTRLDENLKNKKISLDSNLSLIFFPEKHEEYIDYYRLFIKKEYNINLSSYFLLYDFGTARKEKGGFEASEKFRVFTTSVKLITKNNCECDIHFAINDKKQPPEYFRPFILRDKWSHSFRSSKVSTISSENIEDIKNIYSKLSGLKLERGDTYSRLKNAINFFEHAHRENWILLKITLLFIALESLFSDSDSDIAYKIRVRVPFLLYPNEPERRREVFNFLKEGYDIRSSFVHGSEIKDATVNKKLAKLKNNNDYHYLWDLVPDLNSIVCDVLAKIISNDKTFNLFSKNKPTESERKELKDFLDSVAMGLVI